jgi:hypothetical protein
MPVVADRLSVAAAQAYCILRSIMLTWSGRISHNWHLHDPLRDIEPAE